MGSAEGAIVSKYEASRVCYLARRDPAFGERLREDPAAALGERGFDLSADERDAFVRGDVGHLYDIGVHPLLLMRLLPYEVGGLTAASYSTALSARDSG